jgi:hypothetical protein
MHITNKSDTKNRTVRTIISIIREHNPPDIANADYTNDLKVLIPSLEYDVPIFCDNVILWSIGKNRIDRIRRKCKEDFGNSFRIDLLAAHKGVSELIKDDIAPQGTQYFSLKISLSEVSIEKVLYFLGNITSDNVILHDIDITQDVPYITNRETVEEHILGRGIEKRFIVSDLHKVGKNCISFYNRDPLDDTGSTLLRIKVYNKFIQMLESSSVRTTLGSRLHNIFVDPTDSMKRTFLRTRKVGLTRIEVKFYGQEIRSLDYYIRKFMRTKIRYLQGCKFYKASFEHQWRELINKIYKDQVIMVYLKRDNIFAYCHWWNSITKKMQGCYNTISQNDDLKTLIANYSFNEMTTKLIIVDTDGEVCKEYKRVTNAITLIPGPQRGLYPQSRAQLSPEDVGLVEYRGISIGWPDCRIRPSDGPLAQIIEISESEEVEIITHFSGYKVAYSVLKPYSRYKVIAKGVSEWRGREYLFLDIINCNDSSLLKIRCGEQLCKLMIDKTKKTYFITQNLIPGGRDINVELYRESPGNLSDSDDSYDISDDESIRDKVQRLRVEYNI